MFGDLDDVVWHAQMLTSFAAVAVCEVNAVLRIIIDGNEVNGAVLGERHDSATRYLMAANKRQRRKLLNGDKHRQTRRVKKDTTGE